MDAVANILKTVDRTIAEGPFSACWSSLENYRIPRWYKDAKFGIFIHWGAYSVPAFCNEWYPHSMYQKVKDQAVYQHHLDTYGPHTKFGYKDFIPKLTAERFDPAAWAELFRKAGARFIVPVAEHHDGFAMYDCSLSRWTATKMGPRRDIIGDLAKAVRREGMLSCLSSHRAEHWWFFHGGTQFDSDVQDPRFQDLYGPAKPKEAQPDAAFLDDWLARTCELVDKYRPRLVWFDWWIEEPAFAPYLKRFAAFYYNRAAQWGEEVAINYKNESFREGTAVFDIERGQMSQGRPLLWQTDTAVSKNSWGYIQNHDYKTAGDVIGDLVDIVSKNGALLLNIGPKPDGTLPEPEQKLLLEIGRWLSANGEAIYGTRPWKLFGEGPTEIATGHFTDTKRKAYTAQDIRFTCREDTLYAFLLAWPDNRKVTITSLRTDKPQRPQTISRVEWLGNPEALRWTQNAEGLTVDLPEKRPGEHVTVLKILPAH